jgi:hypothetical protein
VNKKNLFFLLIISTLNLFANNKISNMIIPTPQKVVLNNGTYKFPGEVSIGISNPELKFTAKKIAENLKSSFNIKSKISARGKDIKLKIVKTLSGIELEKSLLEQAYILTISTASIKIEAITPQGLFYGAMSLLQLIERSVVKEIPTVTIFDWPDMNIRGVSDDISRGQVSRLQNFKRIIDFIARYKMNVYMPYLEDMLEFEEYPSIGKGRGALTDAEVNEIVRYASQRYIDVIPAFQTLGHFENILTQKEFVKYAEFPGAASLAVTEKKTYRFLENMLKKVFKLFPSEYINIGADESYDVGYGKSKELTDKIGVAKVHAEHYKKVFNICKKYNKKIMMYGDMILHHPDILEYLPNDITIIDWHYGAYTRYSSTDIFNKAGFKFIVSPSVWNFRTTFPTYQIALPNIKSIVKNGLLNNSVGMINSNWGDYGAETFKELVLFGYAWSAQCSWNYNNSDLASFNNSFFTDFFGIDDYKLNSLYKTFSTSFNQMQWHEVWRHPALELPQNAWWAPHINREEISSWMEWTLPDALNIINEFENIVSKNKDHFDLLKFLIRLDFWYSEKKLKANYYLQSIITLNNLKEKLKDRGNNKEDILNEIYSLEKRIDKTIVEEIINENIAELKSLRAEYKKLWLKYYKKENLNMITDKFNRLIAYFEEAKTDVKNGTLDNPEIKSKWIYAPKRGKTAYKKAEFKREVKIRNPVKKAHLQLLADTHAKLYINNKFVGEIYSKQTLSLLTEYDRYLFIDATKYFKKGKNTIKVIAQNYRGSTGAGINFIAKITTTGGTFELISDKTWVARSIEPKRKWKKVIQKDYKFIVIAPNFKTGRTSWIER